MSITDTQTAPWQDLLPADMTVEQDGKQVPIREIPFFKEPKDFQSFAKQSYDAHKEVGARIRIPGKDAKPEDIAAFQKRLTESGVLPTPPASPAEYAITKPDSLPDGQAWNDHAAGKLAEVLHKHGAPKALAADLLALHSEMLQAQQAEIQGSPEEATAALKKEFGPDYDTRLETAKRLVHKMFTPEEITFYDRIGASNKAQFLAPLMRLGPLAMQDSSFLPASEKEGGGAEAGETVRAEVGRIMSDKTHPDHANYWRGDKATLQKIEEMYRKVYGTGKVELH